ncbi:MAG: response regulator [Magnetococcus sp. YQC-5]
MSNECRGFDVLNQPVKTRMRRLASNLTILVSDDDYRFRQKLVEEILQPLQFKKLIQAANGTEAWNAFKEHRTDLVFTDFDMPGQCGTELLHNCADLNRSEGRLPPLGVIISKYEDSVAIREMLFGLQIQYVAKKTVQGLLDLQTHSSNVTLPLDKQEEERFWNTILNILQWAGDVQ